MVCHFIGTPFPMVVLSFAIDGGAIRHCAFLDYQLSFRSLDVRGDTVLPTLTSHVISTSPTDFVGHGP